MSPLNKNLEILAWSLMAAAIIAAFIRFLSAPALARHTPSLLFAVGLAIFVYLLAQNEPTS